MKSLRDQILTMEGRASVALDGETHPVAHLCRGVADDERWHLGQRQVHLTCACGKDLGWRKARAGEQVAG